MINTDRVGLLLHFMKRFQSEQFLNAIRIYDRVSATLDECSTYIKLRREKKQHSVQHSNN